MGQIYLRPKNHRDQYFPATLTLSIKGKRAEGVFTFRHFEEAIGPEIVESKIRVEGKFTGKKASLPLRFVEWIGPPPNDHPVNTTRLAFDSQLLQLEGNGVTLAKIGSEAAQTLLREHHGWDRLARSLRFQDARRRGRGSDLEQERRIRARKLEEQNSKSPRSLAKPWKDGSPIARAGSVQARCRMVAQWAGRLKREGRRAANKRISANLFSDGDFIPVFGLPYDQTTKDWRRQAYDIYIYPCLSERKGQSEFEQVDRDDLKAIQRGFDQLSRSTSEDILADLDRKREIRKQLLVLRQADAPSTLPGCQQLKPLVNSLFNPPEGFDLSFWDLWPSELEAGRTDVGRQFEDCLRVGLEPWRERLEALPPTDEGIRGFQAWQSEFNTATEGLQKAPIYLEFQEQIPDKLRLLVAERFLAWKQELAATPRTLAGMQDAYKRLVNMPLHHLHHPYMRQYREEYGAFRVSVLDRFEELVQDHPTGSQEMKDWYVGLAVPAAESGIDLLRRMGPIQISVSSMVAAPGWVGSIAPVLEGALANHLRGHGVTLDSSSTRELIVELDGTSSSVKTTLSRSQQQSVHRVDSMWAKARLTSPVTVERESGAVFRTRAVVLVGHAARSIKSAKGAEALVAEFVNGVSADLEQSLRHEANELARGTWDSDSWREVLLNRLPRLGELHRNYHDSRVRTRDGETTSLTGVSLMGGLSFDYSIHDYRGLRAPEEWSLLNEAFGWRRPNDQDEYATRVFPMHDISGRIYEVERAKGDVAGNRFTELVVRIDRASIYERNCIVDHPVQPFLAGCYPVSVTNFGVHLKSDRTGEEQQLSRSVTQLLTEIQDALR